MCACVWVYMARMCMHASDLFMMHNNTKHRFQALFLLLSSFTDSFPLLYGSISSFDLAVVVFFFVHSHLNIWENILRLPYPACCVLLSPVPRHIGPPLPYSQHIGLILLCFLSQCIGIFAVAVAVVFFITTACTPLNWLNWLARYIFLLGCYELLCVVSNSIFVYFFCSLQLLTLSLALSLSHSDGGF